MTAKNIILKTSHPVADNRTIIIDALRRVRITEGPVPSMVHAPEEKAPQIGEIKSGDAVAVTPESPYHLEKLRKRGPPELTAIARQPSIGNTVGMAGKRHNRSNRNSLHVPPQPVDLLLEHPEVFINSLRRDDITRLEQVGHPRIIGKHRESREKNQRSEARHSSPAGKDTPRAGDQPVVNAKPDFQDPPPNEP